MPKYGAVAQGGDPEPFLPAWLQALILCSTHQPLTATASSNHSTIEIQLTAVSTLIELASVLNTSLAAGRKQAADNVESVVVTMDPLLKEAHLQRICADTETIRLVASSLWRNLGTVKPAYHIQCVTLLHRLLELAPHASLVENVVAESLQSDISASSVNVFRRFAQLWHLSRELTGARRTLDLCLLKMVSGLRSEKSAVRTLCERWVEHALQRGDSGRLLEPLLLALLDPSSARLSVLHANIKESSGQATETPVLPSSSSSPRLSRVFAISSIDNNIIYHISNSKPMTTSTSGRSSSKVQSVTGMDGRTSTTTIELHTPEFLSKFPRGRGNKS